MQVNHLVLYQFPITYMLLLRDTLSRISVKCCVLNNLVCCMWLEIMTYNLSRTTVTNKVALIIGVFHKYLTNKYTKTQVLWPRAIHKRRNWNFYYLLPLEDYMFLQVYIMVLAVTFKHYANLHTSGCGHFSGKSCQLSVSSNGKATRGKQD